MNRELPFLQGGSLGITLTVPLNNEPKLIKYNVLQVSLGLLAWNAYKWCCKVIRCLQIQRIWNFKFKIFLGLWDRYNKKFNNWKLKYIILYLGAKYWTTLRMRRYDGNRRHSWQGKSFDKDICLNFFLIDRKN